MFWTLNKIKSKSRVDKKTKCHVWKMCLNSDGYARLSINGNTNIKVHRLVYSLAHPEEDICGKVIRHTCDNPECVNPRHLLSGTAGDNMLDRDIRNRHGLAKLNDEKAINIRKLYASGNFLQRELAEMYDVDGRTISYVILRKTWKHC